MSERLTEAGITELLEWAEENMPTRLDNNINLLAAEVRSSRRPPPGMGEIERDRAPDACRTDPECYWRRMYDQLLDGVPDAVEAAKREAARDREARPPPGALSASPSPEPGPERRALENVRALVVSRKALRDSEWAEPLLRFCREGGVEGSILRASPSPETRASFAPAAATTDEREVLDALRGALPPVLRCGHHRDSQRVVLSRECTCGDSTCGQDVTAALWLLERCAPSPPSSSPPAEHVCGDGCAGCVECLGHLDDPETRPCFTSSAPPGTDAAPTPTDEET